MIWLLACSILPEERPEEKLAAASNTVIFASVEKLGAHHYEARVRRKELREETITSNHDEIIIIDWQDWDNFRYSRTLDTKEVSSLIVSNHIPWLKNTAQKWSKYEDAEPYRTELRTSWNTWEQYVGRYETLITWKPIEEDIIADRKVTRYELLYQKENDAPKNTEPTNLTLSSLSGSIAVDQATAVRIYAEVKLVLTGDKYRKEIDLQIKRTDIGVQKNIPPPQ